MILLRLRKRKQSKAAASESGAVGYGVKSRSGIDEMDCVQPLCDDEMVTTAIGCVSELNCSFCKDRL